MIQSRMFAGPIKSIVTVGENYRVNLRLVHVHDYHWQIDVLCVFTIKIDLQHFV